MAETVGDYVLYRLRDWDVEHGLAYPVMGSTDSSRPSARAGNRPRFVQARHEEMAAFQAVGYAKFSGRVGVCMATSGPGAIHLLNGLYDAKLDHVPVVAIVGQTARSAMGGSYQQEVDLQVLFKDVASEYLVEVDVAEQLPNAMSERAPTAVIIPADLQEEEYVPPKQVFKNVPSSPPGVVRPNVRPSDEDIVRAAEVLNAGQRVAILIGQGARSVVEELHQVAELWRYAACPQRSALVDPEGPTESFRHRSRRRLVPQARPAGWHRTGDHRRAVHRLLGRGEPDEQDPSCRCFDIRVMIAAMIGLSGAVSTVMGIGFTSAEDIEKSAGLNINLWAGTGMLVVVAAFPLWARW